MGTPYVYNFVQLKKKLKIYRSAVDRIRTYACRAHLITRVLVRAISSQTP